MVELRSSVYYFQYTDFSLARFHVGVVGCVCCCGIIPVKRCQLEGVYRTCLSVCLTSPPCGDPLEGRSGDRAADGGGAM